MTRPMTSGESERLASHVLHVLRQTLEAQKRKAERAMAQLEPDQLHWSPDPESNSVAIIVKHLAGNMRSRWTDFLTSDGDKPDRDRDAEFVDEGADREELMRRWEDGWARLFATLDELAPGDLLATVTIRGREQTALEAIVGQVSHYAEHVGQIVYLAKHLRGSAWQTLSIPRAQRPGSAQGGRPKAD